MLFIPVVDSQGSASCIANRGSAFEVKLSLLEAFSWLVSWRSTLPILPELL